MTPGRRFRRKPTNTPGLVSDDDNEGKPNVLTPYFQTAALISVAEKRHVDALKNQRSPRIVKKRTVYTHKAFELDEVHLKTLRTIFTLLDKDQDKLLNVQELRLAIVAMGIPPSKRLIDEISRSAPSWAGKGIDFGTFQRVIVDRLKSNPIHMADVDELFRLFEDSNERGAVTPGNLRHLMTRVKTSNSTQLSNHEVDEIFDELDIKDTPVYYRRFLTDISSGFVNFTYPMRR